MPKGYWIVRVSVKNAEHYPEYLAAARPAFEKYGARFLVRGGRFEAMEGSSRERNVVVAFDVRLPSATPMPTRISSSSKGLECGQGSGGVHTAPP
jgi:hypothetical protein